MGRLTGKVAIISGAARGQGAEHARQFVAHGARVVLGDILDDLGRSVAEELGDAATYCRLDVTSEDDWATAVAQATSQFGSVTTLINNAGILTVGALEDITAAEYMHVVSVNQLGCFLGMRAVAPAMREAGGGSIINTSSIAGQIGVPGVLSYVATKFAIRGMTKSAAMELGHSGIRVNSVHPGTIDTPMISMPEFETVDRDGLFASLPIQRMGQPIDVSNMMVFLASDESSYCTGSEFYVDGGVTAGPPVHGIVD
ncbi:MAG: glucose 1-dehydrogenase [Ilumatobacteraceae bacterium]